MHYRLPLLLVLGALLGCPAGEPVPPERGPVVVTGPSRDAIVQVLLEEPATAAASLRDHSVIAATPAGLVRIDLLSGAAWAIEGEATSLNGLAERPDGTILVSTDSGLFQLQDDVLLPSPLQELAPLGLASLLAEGDDLWLAAPDELLRWSDGLLERIEPDGQPVVGAMLFPGPSPLDRSAGVWAVSDELAWYFDLGDGSGTAASMQAAGDASGDASGTAWFAEPGGLVRVQQGPTVTHFLLPSEARPRGNPASDVTWVQSGTSVWRHRAGSWIQMEGLPEEAAVVGVDHAGRLLLAGEGGLMRAAPERHLLLLGLDDGSPLEGVTRYVVPAPFAATQPDEILAEIDGTPAEWTEDGVRLDPAELSDGAHGLAVEAIWPDGERATASLFFSVGEFIPPTWSDDIEPLFDRSCTPCHAPSGGAHLLDNQLAWQAEIDDILLETQSGRMPLNNGTDPNFVAMSDAEIDVIQWWRAGGFLP